jgi:hypothetical protein
VIADAVEWAAVLSVALPLVLFFEYELQRGGVRGSLSTVLVGYVVPVLILALFTSGRARVAGMLGFTWALVHVWVGFGDQLVRFPGGLRSALLPALGFGFMAISRSGTSRSGRWLWILPAATYALMSLAVLPGLIAPARLAAPILLALVPLPLYPAFAVGAALMWAFMGAWLAFAVAGATPWLSIVLLSALPAALILASLGRRVARTR